MRARVLAVAATLTLASACSPENPESEAAADAAMQAAQSAQTSGGTAAAAPDAPSDAGSGDRLPQDYLRTAWRIEDADGALYTTYLDPAGRYRDIRNGDPWRQGAWEVDERERICFTPDGTNVVRNCWTPDRMDDDGGLIVHGDSGRRVRLEAVDYRPVPAVITPAAGASEPADTP